MSVRRFDVYCNGRWDGCTTYEDDNDLGDYVTFEDYAALEAKYAALREMAHLLIVFAQPIYGDGEHFAVMKKPFVALAALVGEE